MSTVSTAPGGDSSDIAIDAFAFGNWTKASLQASSIAATRLARADSSIPAVSAKWFTAPATPASNRGSRERVSSTLPVSIFCNGHHANFAGLPAIRAVILAVHAQANVVLPLTNATIAVALAVNFWLVTNGTDYSHSPARLQIHFIRPSRWRQDAS